MNDPFEILSRFLDRYGDEVEGRALEEMPTEVKTQLRDFAQGKLPETQRGDLFRLLKENPRWIAVLAEEAKAARGGGNA